MRIGDQSDEAFLASIIEEFGVPDVVLDDGGHRPELMVGSFQFLFPRMPKNGVYLIEDTHATYWKEYGAVPGQPNDFMAFAKDCVDRLHADYTAGAIEPNFVTNKTFGISFYDSIVAFERADVFRREEMTTGNRPPLLTRAKNRIERTLAK